MNTIIAALCITMGAKTVALDTTHFTLAWTHSVAKTRWEEDYRLGQDGRLVLTEARIAGTGPGMEPPPHAQLRAGVWHYVPDLPPLPELRLTISPYTADYDLCWNGRCQKLTRILSAPLDPAVATITACAAATHPNTAP